MFTSQAKKEDRFWEWFIKNDERIFHFEKNQNRIFTELGKSLAKINKYLTFEFGPINNGVREFVISADGIKEAFPVVESLHSKAPDLSNWKFTKFRPRRSPMDLQFGDIYIKPEDVLATLNKDGSKVDITVFLKGAGGANDQLYQRAAFIILDQAIGEYDMETKVGLIQTLPYNSPSTIDKVSLAELPTLFDSLTTI